MQPGDPFHPTPLVPDLDLIRQIDAGSSGSVWIAKTVTGRWRAVKVVHQLPGGSTHLVDRELDGIRHIEELTRSHPNLTQIFRVGLLATAVSPGLYIVLELADDAQSARSIDPAAYVPRTLQFDLQSKHHHSLEECFFLLAEITSGLAFLHRNHLVHRDLKPSNVIFVNGHPKLADFGLVSAPQTLTSGVGTPGFMPPEGGGYPPGDIFALGRLALQLLWGNSPEPYLAPPPNTGEWEDYSKRLELHDLALRACDPNPDARPADGTDFLNELLEIARALGVDPHVVSSPTPIMSWLRLFDPRNLGPIAVITVSLFFALASNASASRSSAHDSIKSWLFFCLGIVALFELANKGVPGRRKRTFGRWLQNVHRTPTPEPWATTLLHTFEHYFSPRHLSWTCLSRTAALSSVTTILFLVLFYAVDSERFTLGSGYLVTWQAKISLVAFTWIITLLPNYLSTFKTRWILQRLALHPRTPAVAVSHIALDLLLSSLILLATILGASLASKEIMLALDVNEYFITRNIPFYRLGIYQYSDTLPTFIANSLLLRDIYGVFVYSTYLTSAWIWLFIATNSLNQPSAPLGALLQRFRANFDLAHNPFRSLEVAALSATLALGAFTAPFYLWKSQSLNAVPRANLQTLTHPIDRFQLVRIPAHTSKMGTDDITWPSAYPSISVPLSDYYIGATEVTQAHWNRLMGANSSTVQHPQVPVYGISWFEAVMYIYKLNAELKTLLPQHPEFTGFEFRLPTEAEWESACRAGTSTPFPFPESRFNDYAWTFHNSGGAPRPVATKLPNAWGLYDMQGNVREWTSDWFVPHHNLRRALRNQSSPTGHAPPHPTNPKAEGRGKRSIRGGSWFSDASLCRSFTRLKLYPDAIRTPTDTQPQTVGLRLVLARKPGLPDCF